MKTLNTVIKILTALATVAGVVYVIATYGDKIVAWAKDLWAKMPQCPACEEIPEEEVSVEEAAPAAEEAVEVAEPAAEEPAVEVVVEENEPVAEESDFAE